MPGFIRTKIISVIALMLLAGSTALAQEPMLIPPGVEVISLDKAIDLALLNNREAKNARLEVGKSDDRTAAARTHLLPVFKLNAGVTKPLSTFDTTFEKGVFGTAPTEDTVITSSTNPTAAIIGQIQQPLSQLHRILDRDDGCRAEQSRFDRVQLRRIGIFRHLASRETAPTGRIPPQVRYERRTHCAAP